MAQNVLAGKKEWAIVTHTVHKIQECTHAGGHAHPWQCHHCQENRLGWWCLGGGTKKPRLLQTQERRDSARTVSGYIGSIASKSNTITCIHKVFLKLTLVLLTAMLFNLITKSSRKTSFCILPNNKIISGVTSKYNTIKQLIEIHHQDIHYFFSIL